MEDSFSCRSNAKPNGVGSTIERRRNLWRPHTCGLLWTLLESDPEDTNGFRMGFKTLPVLLSFENGRWRFSQHEGIDFTFEKSENPSRKALHWWVNEHPTVKRHGKWKVSQSEYNGTFYPPFCPGLGIVLSPDVVDAFVSLFDVVQKFRLDDVYIALLANKIEVKPIHNPNLEVWPNNKDRCRFINRTLVRHAVTGECLFKVYNEMLSYLSAVKGWEPRPDSSPVVSFVSYVS